MKTVLAAFLALSVAGLSVAPTAQAADQPYWRQHQEVEWQQRSEFREPEHQKPTWLGDHCVRDWGGKELCRR
jgi:hypothetical protein